MTESEREELIYNLLDQFKASVGSISDQQKYSFIAGARCALVTVADEIERLRRENAILHRLEARKND